MNRVSIYLNTIGRTEEQFRFYGSVFGSEPTALQRMSEVPAQPGQPELPEDERDAVMHVELEILGGTVLMGTDMLRSMGHELRIGNNVAINLEPETLAEGQRIFAALSEGATDVVPLQEMFWGAQWGVLLDRYGVRWMVNVPASDG
ncbi:MAG: VOC family protein [Actinomycetales bacterium]|nr:VOC family protein [Actinomycetales bacterium]